VKRYNTRKSRLLMRRCQPLHPVSDCWRRLPRLRSGITVLGEGRSILACPSILSR
jgi:hypothetical protein